MGIRTIEFDCELKKLKIAVFREALTREIAVLGIKKTNYLTGMTLHFEEEIMVN